MVSAQATALPCAFADRIRRVRIPHDFCTTPHPEGFRPQRVVDARAVERRYGVGRQLVQHIRDRRFG